MSKANIKRPGPQQCQGSAILTSFAHHRSQQFGHNGAPFSHLALFAVRKVGNHADNAFGTRGLTRVNHYQELHDGGVHIPAFQERKAQKGHKT